MNSFLKTIARHALGALAGGATSAVAAPALANQAANPDDVVATIATAVALFVYAAVEKALKPLWAKLGE